MGDWESRGGRQSALRVLIVVALIGAVALGAGILIRRHAIEQVSGTVRVEDTAVGTFTFSVDDCASGHAFVPGFFGADLRGQGKFDLRLIESGDDAQLWLFPPGVKRGAIPFTKADCTRWDVLNDWAHVTVNRVSTVSGHVHVTCKGLTADVDFVRCAF